MNEDNSANGRATAPAGDRVAWPLLVGLTSVLALTATVNFSLLGHTAVVAHLFYIPVILAAYRYLWRGLLFDIGLAIGYLLVTGLMFAADPMVLSAAAVRVLALVAVGALVARLAAAVRDAERRASVQRDLAVCLEAARSRGEVAEATAQALWRLPECDACAVYVGSAHTGYSLAASRGISDAFAERIAQIEVGGPHDAVVLADAPTWDTYARIAHRAGVGDDPVRRAEGLCGIGIVPIHFETEVLGTVVVASRSHHFFRRTTQLTVELIATQMGASLARIDALMAMHRRHATTEILYEAARELSGTLDPQLLLERIAEQAATAVGAAECALWRYDEHSDSEVFLTLYQRDPDPDVKASLVGSRYPLADYPEDREIILGHRVVEYRVGDPDVPESSRRSMEEWGEKTCLHIPLRSAGRPYGLMIIVETDRERHFTDDEVRLVTALGEHAAVAMENAELFASLDRHGRRLKALLESSRALTSSVDMERVLHETAAAAAHALQTPQCVLCEYDAELDTLLHRAVWDETPLQPATRLLGSLVHVIPGDPSWRALHERRPICQRLSDPDLDVTSRQLMETRGQSAALSVPLVFAGKALGLITLIETERDRQFSDSDVEIAQALADQAAVAIHNARLFQSLQELAVHDGLTGLYNHRYFHERLRDEVARARRYDEPVSLLMIDIDDFKRVNDRYGHPVGDEILRALAQVLKTQVRAGADVAARYGGEELALILPNTPLARADGHGTAGLGTGGRARAGLGTGGRTAAGRRPAPPSAALPDTAAADLSVDTAVAAVAGAPASTLHRPPRLDGAAAIAERIRAMISASTYATEQVPGGVCVTVSIGVAGLRPGGKDTPGDLLARADAALYRAKQAGKDRVALSD